MLEALVDFSDLVGNLCDLTQTIWNLECDQNRTDEDQQHINELKEYQKTIRRGMKIVNSKLIEQMESLETW